MRVGDVHFVCPLNNCFTYRYITLGLCIYKYGVSDNRFGDNLDLAQRQF